MCINSTHDADAIFNLKDRKSVYYREQTGKSHLSSVDSVTRGGDAPGS